MLKNKFFSLRVVMTFTALVFLIPNNLHADDKIEQLTFTQALSIARKNNAQIFMANERVQQALHRIKEGKSFFYPHIDANISQARQTRDLRSTGTHIFGQDLIGPFNTYDARLKMTQAIFDWEIVERWKQYQESAELTKAQQKSVEQDALATVAILFIQAKRAHEKIHFIEMILERDKARLHLEQIKFEQGTSYKLAVQEAQSILAKSEYDLNKAKEESNISRMDLLAALGLSLDKQYHLIWNISLNTDMEFSKKKIKELIPNQPDVFVSQEELRVAQKEERVQKASRLPKVELSGDYGQSGIEPGDANDTYSIGVKASLPIFDGGLRKERIKEAKSKSKESEEHLEDTQRQVTVNVFKKKNFIKESLVYLEEKTTESKAAKSKLEYTQQQFAVGQTSQIMLKDAQANFAAAYDQQQEAEALYLIAQIQLKHSLGRMDHLTKENE